jgi:hypothetical protein
MTAVEWLIYKLEIFATEEEMNIIEQAKEMEKEQKIDFAKMHVKIALKAVENEMILQASSVKHWYLPQNIK